ncbi:hypothetical protein GCM10010531_19440 [Blastococcus jejuensis]|uniref:Uncharacterized protein n=1 Tax=Blastococcus jejuensis TaxID=351224 RepID=A0ABP6P4I0_9ACTN
MRLLRMAAAYSNGPRALAISGGYAVAVLGVTVVVVLARGLSSVWLVVLTLPSSALVQLIPAQGNLFVLCLTLAGLVQASLLWLLLRGTRLSGLPAG